MHRVLACALATIVAAACRDGSREVELRPVALVATQPTAAEFVEFARNARPGMGSAVLSDLRVASASTAFVVDLCDIAKRAWADQPTAALIPLSLLGEVKSNESVDCLKWFMRITWPTKGTCVGDDPEHPCARIVEQEGLAVVQAKALEGLGFYRTLETDEIVLKTVSDHPDRGLRARAALVFMWNHEGDPNARATIARYLRPGEESFAKRLTKKANESALVFDRRLEEHYGIKVTNRRGLK